MPHALIVMQDQETRRRLAEAVRAEAFTVSLADGVEEGVKRIGEDSPDLLLLDLCFRDGSAVDILEEARNAGVGSAVLVGAAGGESPEESLRRNVTAFLGGPFDSQALLPILNQVANSTATSEEVARERERIESGHFGRLVGISDAMRRLYKLLSRVAPSQASVFLSGESGVGKEMVARTIHDLSPRRRKPFVPVNCGAISPNLMESELFGHEKGSFSGASRRRRGYFEQADGGTLFLDEITEMPSDLQVKLLRVLESGKVMRVGAEQSVQVDVRILAATNREPKAAIEENRMREDLYYRLRVLHIGIPPLRERVEDIPLLAEVLLEEISAREGVTKELCPEILAVLKDYDWPGNVRELRNALYTAYLLSDGERVVAKCLPPEVQGGVHHTDPGARVVHIPVGTSIKEAERRLILTTLAHLEGRKSKAAEILEVSLKTLYNRLHDYGYMEKEAEGENGAS
jgi:two-component system, NtrC family, response regulator AtoC